MMKYIRALFVCNVFIASFWLWIILIFKNVEEIKKMHILSLLSVTGYIFCTHLLGLFY